ncbi:MAG: hypothetical protein P4M14_01350 [Gammaproteobacteria bacterium]|nr:hypothetical protein [Gammaproteobacteria bacterium]
MKEKYAALYRQWVEKYGPEKAFQAALAELGLLGYAADDLSKEKDLKLRSLIMPGFYAGFQPLFAKKTQKLLLDP